MIYCTKCGAQIHESAAFCPSCGTAVAASSTPPAPPPPPQAGPPPPPQAQYNYNYQQPMAQNSDAEANKGMAIIAYILFFVPLLTGDVKKSPFVKFHTNQGTILFIFTVALGIAINIVLAILRAILFNVFAWGLFGVLSTLLNILWLAPTVLLVLGIINAAGGKTTPLPIIGDKIEIIK